MADAAAPLPASAAALSGDLPELAGVSWRRRADEESLHRADRMWTSTTIAHEVPFLATAVALPLLSFIMIPMSVVALVFAWVIPELYAARGAGVLRAPRGGGRSGAGGGSGATVSQQRALGLLGDLIGHDARALLGATGLVVEPGRLGSWVIAGAGALLVRPGGRRVQCYCVRVADGDLPHADRVAHLLLALRADESGFATVANLSFSGAVWRLRRRVSPAAREALAVAVAAARTM